MLCALTVRKLKPGKFDDFKSTFTPDDGAEDVPSQWKQFNLVRNTADENEVVTFGFFDGTLDDFRSQDRTDYDARIKKIDEFVESVEVDGVFEVVEQRTMD